MDTDSLYHAPSEKELEDCIRPEKRKQSGSNCDQRVELIVSLPTQLEFSPEGVVSITKNKASERLDNSMRSSDVQRRYVYIARRVAVIILPRRKIYLVV